MNELHAKRAHDTACTQKGLVKRAIREMRERCMIELNRTGEANEIPEFIQAAREYFDRLEIVAAGRISPLEREAA